MSQKCPTLPRLVRPLFFGHKGCLQDAQAYSTEQLFASLPSPGKLDKTFSPSPMPYLTEAESINNPELLSPFCGAVLVASLVHKVFEHTMQSTDRESHRDRVGSSGFWDRHYKLVKLLGVYGELLKPLFTMCTLYCDPLAFDLYMSFCALELRLYKAAADEGENQGLSYLVSSESTKQVLASALKIATAVRSTWPSQRLAVSPFIHFVI